MSGWSVDCLGDGEASGCSNSIPHRMELLNRYSVFPFRGSEHVSFRRLARTLRCEAGISASWGGRICVSLVLRAETDFVGELHSLPGPEYPKYLEYLSVGVETILHRLR